MLFSYMQNSYILIKNLCILIKYLHLLYCKVTFEDKFRKQKQSTYKEVVSQTLAELASQMKTQENNCKVI